VTSNNENAFKIGSRIGEESREEITDPAGLKGRLILSTPFERSGHHPDKAPVGVFIFPEYFSRIARVRPSDETAL